MPNLHIEHAITDLDTWLRTFNSFASARRVAGVLEDVFGNPTMIPATSSST